METTVLSKEWLIASEVELIYKSKVKASQRPHITSSYSAYQVALTAWDGNKIELLEQFKVLMLSNNNKVLGVLGASSGGITGIPNCQKNSAHTNIRHKCKFITMIVVI